MLRPVAKLNLKGERYRSATDPLTAEPSYSHIHSVRFVETLF